LNTGTSWPELLLAGAVHQLDPGDRDPGVTETLDVLNPGGFGRPEIIVAVAPCQSTD
jgi:hypothetical protein